MTTAKLGIVVGGFLGLLDGLAAALVARWRMPLARGIATGVAVGLVLSTLAVWGQPDHYRANVAPGMLLGGLVGFVTQRYPPRLALPSRASIGVSLATRALWPALASGQSASTAPDPFALIAGVVGKWTGTSEGQPGKATVEREYERVFGTRFIRVRNRSTYAPQEKNPKGEVHQDEGFFSFDRSRKRIVFRQFHVEGFVNQYVEDPQRTPSSIVFLSEAIENIPPGYRAKETYVIHGPDDLEEVFELAEPGKPFTVYSRTRLKRVR